MIKIMIKNEKDTKLTAFAPIQCHHKLLLYNYKGASTMMNLPTNNHINHLISEIEYLRSILVEIGTQKGIDHDQTLEISEILNKFITEYQRIRLFG